MGTRTNFYKNPSFTYNKDFDLNSVLQNLRAYNAATGNAPPVEEPVPADEKIVRHKRRRKQKLYPDRRNEIEENDGPMSHQDYIEKMRKEANSAQAFEEFPANVLDASSSVIQLVEYDSDRSTSSGCEEKQETSKSGSGLDICEKEQNPLISDNINAVNRVKNRSEQRFAVPGEPVCVVCGKYGEYICNETDDDICSMDCKTELLEKMELHQSSLSNQTSVESSSGHKFPLQISEYGGDTWDYNRHRWSTKRSSLCTYECWKCRRPGHLAEDCLVMGSNPRSLSSDETREQVAFASKRPSFIARDLLELYKRCHQIGRKSSAVKCCSCASSSTLAACIECSITFCDRSFEQAYQDTSFSSAVLLL